MCPFFYAGVPRFIRRSTSTGAPVRHHGYVVFEAADGQEALSLTGVAIPSLIVTDLHMPGVDGYSLICGLKEQATTASIPVLVITADVRAETRADALFAGCAAFLVKPVKLADFLCVVQTLMGSGAAVPVQPMQFGVSHERIC